MLSPRAAAESSCHFICLTIYKKKLKRHQKNGNLFLKCCLTFTVSIDDVLTDKRVELLAQIIFFATLSVFYHFQGGCGFICFMFGAVQLLNVLILTLLCFQLISFS